MKIERGGSVELSNGQWVKFTVELDETDLQRMLIENDLDNAQLSVREVFSLLEAEAETLVTVKMEQLGAKAEVSARDQAQRVSKLLARFRDNYLGGIGDNEI